MAFVSGADLPGVNARLLPSPVNRRPLASVHASLKKKLRGLAEVAILSDGHRGGRGNRTLASHDGVKEFLIEDACLDMDAQPRRNSDRRVSILVL
jgi:hypothetical protein